MRMKPSTVHCLLLTLFLSACLGLQDPAPVSRYTPGEGAGTTGIHTVSRGETLWLISKRYAIAMRDIAVANRLSPPYQLPPGTRLKLPPPQQYKVRRGDSLNTVSRLFGVSRSEIASLNKLRPPYTLRAGQDLRLPSITEKNEPEVFAQASPLAAVPPEPVKAEELPPLPGVAIAPKKPEHVLVKPVRAMEAAVPQSPAVAKTPKRSSSKFLIPVAGKIVSDYGPKDSGLYNDGINIRAPRDAPVRAAENGVVVYAGDELKGSGNLVLIRHADRWTTAYAHMGKILVKRGDVVRRGAAIGTVGSTGSVDTPQLHFELRRGTEALNPEVYLEG